jgi:hypothetical protein
MLPCEVLGSAGAPRRALPGMGGARLGAAPGDVAFVQAKLQERGSARIPNNFTPTAPAYDPSKGPRQRGTMPTEHVRNPQVRVITTPPPHTVC